MSTESPVATSQSIDPPVLVTADSASDISPPRSGIAPTSRPAAPPSVRRRRRRSCRGADAASPCRSMRTLPHDAQDANSPSVRRRRTAPQWPHQQVAGGAIAAPRSNVTSTHGEDLCAGGYIILGKVSGTSARDQMRLANVHRARFRWLSKEFGMCQKRFLVFLICSPRRSQQEPSQEGNLTA